VATTTCPHDGEALEPLDGDGETAPFLCRACSRGWWPSQLTPSARALWDRALHGYPPGVAPALEVAAYDERDARRKAKRPKKKEG
jgi:hypothetical protein